MKACQDNYQDLLEEDLYVYANEKKESVKR